MIQLPNIVCMFAMSTDQADKTYSISKRLFLCLNGSVVSKDIRLSNPYMAILTYCLNCLLGRRWDETAFSVSIHLKFIHSMTKQNEICDARNNSTLKATCAHDTGKLPICGNPYLDLAQHGFDLHSCDVRFLKKPNANGHTVTGVFNVSGKWHTAASHNYEGLIQYLLTILYRRRDYIADRQKAKRDAKRK